LSSISNWGSGCVAIGLWVGVGPNSGGHDSSAGGRQTGESGDKGFHF